MSRLDSPTHPSRAEWLSARAALAGRRIGRLAPGAAAIFLIGLLVLLVVPQLRGTLRGRAVRSDDGPDTLRLAIALHHALEGVARAESAYAQTTIGASNANGEPVPADPARPLRRDSLQLAIAALRELLDRAIKAPLPASYRALASAPALRGTPRLSRLTDSLDGLDRRRVALGSEARAEHAFAELTTLMTDVGLDIRELALRRLVSLGEARVGRDTAADRAAYANARALATRDRAREVAEAKGDSLARLRTRLVASESERAAASDRVRKRVPPIAILVTMAVLAAVAAFLLSLVTEISRPTIANVREAESVLRCPVTLVSREDLLVRDRHRMDSFHMLYLRVAGTEGARRTIVLSGDEPTVVATVAGRLAFASASEARATLVVDADAETGAVAGYYGQRPEPGFTDAMAGVRLWREVAQSVGASTGLSIDVVPGGSIRLDARTGEERALAREDFARFRGEYDLCVVAVSSESAFHRLDGVLELPVAVICAVLGVTKLARLQALASQVKLSGFALSESVLWDAVVSKVKSRNAMLGRVLPRC